MNRLGRSVGSVTSKALLLSQRLESAVVAVAPTEMSGCHGGYWHQQIILSEARTTTFDWDNYCVANPSRDLARFIIEPQQLALKTHGSLNALDDAVETFYKTYTAISRFEVATSLPIHKAAVCLKRPKSHLRSRGSGPEGAEALLNEGLRIPAEEM